MKGFLKLFSRLMGVQRFATSRIGVQKVATDYNLNNIFDKRLFQHLNRVTRLFENMFSLICTLCKKS